jgi:hypothetical protein
VDWFSPEGFVVAAVNHDGSNLLHQIGGGKTTSSGSGFGARMLAAVVARLGGHLDEEDNMPVLGRS